MQNTIQTVATKEQIVQVKKHIKDSIESFSMRLLFGLILTLILSSCSSEYDKRLKISATTWLGYTPLFYAEVKGWLKPLNIELLNVTSLAENMYLFQAGKSDAYTGTQYEYGVIRAEMPTLRPLMMLNKSNGGDLIMSNLSLKELQDSTEEVDAYLEMDSVNSIVLQDFLNSHDMNQKNIHYFNMDQTQIQNLKIGTRPTLIVTYIPYNIALCQRGFVEIASTKENLNLVVVDALFATQEVYERHAEQFKALKKLLKRAIDALHDDPEEFYSTIKPYLLEMTYEQFEASLEQIVWIHDGISPALKQRLKETNFSTEELLR